MNQEEDYKDVNPLRKKFDDERKQWTEKLTGFAVKFANITSITDLQIDLYTNRQVLVEYSHRLIDSEGKLEKEIRESRRSIYDKYTNSQLRLSVTEKNNLIESDMNDMLDIKHSLITHIEFIKETIKNILSTIPFKKDL